mmetsp:Transcript_9055/g.33778  ORF Transcript_9055/g.33778 Transcript_9055/m.33778 type:complete len:253 (-) Transcript_9055:5407-6165(-)
MKLPGRFGNAAVAFDPNKIPHVRVAVVETHVEWFGHEPLDDGTEHLFRKSREGRDASAAVGDDLLGKTNKPRVPGKRAKHASHFQRLGELAILVHVDGLDVQTRGHPQTEVLVLGLALAHDGKPGQLDAVRLLYDPVSRRDAPRDVPLGVCFAGALLVVIVPGVFAVRGDYAQMAVLPQQLLKRLVVRFVALRAKHLRANNVVVLHVNQGFDIRFGDVLQARQNARRVGVRRHAPHRAQHGLRPAARPTHDL